MAHSEHALLVDDVSVVFDDRPALDGLTLHVPRATIAALLGPNGAGKTTLVRCCTGLVRPRSGSIEVLGAAPGSLRACAGIGVMPQAAGAWAGIRTGELLRYLAGLYANPHDVGALMGFLGIADLDRVVYRRLSGGQQQLVNLAGALVGRPELVLLDEPTAGMDPHVRRRTWDLIAGLRDAGVAVLLNTHAMDEAAHLADHVWIVDAGRIAVHGTVAELTRNRSLEEAFLDATRQPA